MARSWAILHAGKRCENREWSQSPGLAAAARRLVGQTIAIHASAGVGNQQEFSDAVDTVGSIAGLASFDGFAEAHYRKGEDCGGVWIPDPDLPRGAIVGVARLIAIHDHGNIAGHRHHNGVCIGCGYKQSTIAELVAGIADPGPWECPRRDPWAQTGGIGLILDDVRPLATPVPYKGALGFFEVPDEVMAREGADIKGAARRTNV